jgi:hypothetical protein
LLNNCKYDIYYSIATELALGKTLPFAQIGKIFPCLGMVFAPFAEVPENKGVDRVLSSRYFMVFESKAIEIPD